MDSRNKNERTAGAARWRLSLITLATAVLLAACGGGGGGDASSSSTGGTGSNGAGATTTPPVTVSAPAAAPLTRVAAQRFLTQSTFGPTNADVDHLLAVGYDAWFDEQFAKPQALHRSDWEAYDASVKAVASTNSAGQDGVTNSFWKGAVTGDDQLRQRVAFALSEIFVVSMVDSNVANDPRSVAAYLDMLGTNGFGNFRDLLQSVALHPVMGQYLSWIRNQKDDPSTGRVPDQNFAREVMQLFTIGLEQLNVDGSRQMVNGAPVDTYSGLDVAGLARVFTGYSWACPAAPASGCFFGGAVGTSTDADKGWKPMVAYPTYHSTLDKSFLGTTIAANSTSNPDGDLKTALDALYNHPNVGPFIGRQLIQRLVTSNPSAAYVKAVASAFNDNGSGVRGDMKAVIKAVLTNAEARTTSTTAGKLREPVVKLANFMRAFGGKSDSGFFLVGNTDNPGTQLGQTVLRSPSVFNFFRPGYVPPNTQAGTASLTVPEMQLASETTAAGYVNYMRDNVSSGVGNYGSALARRDIQPDFTAQLALAATSSALVDDMNDKLMYGGMPSALKGLIVTAVDSIAIPALNAAGSNQAAIDTAKRTRVNVAVFLTLVSPEFQVQK